MVVIAITCCLPPPGGIPQKGWVPCATCNSWTHTWGTDSHKLSCMALLFSVLVMNYYMPQYMYTKWTQLCYLHTIVKLSKHMSLGKIVCQSWSFMQGEITAFGYMHVGATKTSYINFFSFTLNWWESTGGSELKFDTKMFMHEYLYYCTQASLYICSEDLASG